MREYRIRWGRVSGPWDGRRIMCLAERRCRVFGIFNIWVPLEHGNWRDREPEALKDIEYDKSFNSPLPEPRVV